MECPVDVPETGHSQVKPRVGRPTDDYADVPDMFRSLAGLAEHSDAYQRKHEEIVTRCLPLADNVARHFDRRGEEPGKTLGPLISRCPTEPAGRFCHRASLLRAILTCWYGSR